MRESDDNAVYAAAHLYYERKLTQKEIARELGISCPTVSRLLSCVQQEGIVQIAVREPAWRNSDLKAPLIDTLGLDTVILVPEALKSTRTREILLGESTNGAV